MAIIVSSRIISDDRPKGTAGLVIGEHVFDDGLVWPAMFEAAADDDPTERLDGMIAERNALRARNDAQRLQDEILASAGVKIDAYVKSLPDGDLAANVKLTQEEIDAIKVAP